MSKLTVTVPAFVGDEETTRKLISLPTCPCGDGPVSRFITVGTSTLLGCDLCYRACHTAPEVTHHSRSSHAACEHEATPKDRAACRAARKRGEVYAPLAEDDDADPELFTVGTAKGSKRTHLITDEELACGAAMPRTITTRETDEAGDITCPGCLAHLDDAA